DSPTDDIDNLSVLTLAHADNAVVGVDQLALVSRSTGNALNHSGVIVVRLQSRANPFPRQAHALLEAVSGRRREVIRVRVVRFSNCIHIHTEDVLRINVTRVGLDKSLVSLG